MSRIFRTVFLLATFSIALIVTLTSCSPKAPQKPKIPDVVVTKVQTEDLSRMSSVVGQIVAMEQVELIARVPGFLTKRNFEPGQFVTKGQLLFQLQKDQYEADLLQATGVLKEVQSKLDFTMIEYNRTKVLYSQNATSQEKFQLAEAAMLEAQGRLDAVKAKYQLAMLNLSYTDILSPFDGRIGMYKYSAGNMVDIASEPLAVVTQVDPIWVSFNYSEAIFQNILDEFGNILPAKNDNNFKLVEEKVSVKITLSNGTEYNHLGKIDFINNLIDPLTGTIQIRALFPNPDEKLIAGGYVNVTLESFKKTPCLIIPQSALQEDQTGPFVFVVNSKNIVEQKYVKLGVSEGENVVIAKGLTQDDMVISQGVLKVRPGISVNYVLQKENKGSSPQIPATAAADTDKNVK